MQTQTSTVLALDVGARRVGVATADQATALARPLITLENDQAIFEKIKTLVTERQVSSVVVGTPRNMAGNETQQTRDTLAFIEKLAAYVSVPIELQDEAVTSKQAEEQLKASGKPYAKGDIDALAATYILEDWLNEHGA